MANKPVPELKLLTADSVISKMIARSNPDFKLTLLEGCKVKHDGREKIRVYYDQDIQQPSETVFAEFQCTPTVGIAEILSHYGLTDGEYKTSQAVELLVELGKYFKATYDEDNRTIEIRHPMRPPIPQEFVIGTNKVSGLFFDKTGKEVVKLLLLDDSAEERLAGVYTPGTRHLS